MATEINEEDPLPVKELRNNYQHLLRSPLKRSKPPDDDEGCEHDSEAAALSPQPGSSSPYSKRCEVEMVDIEEFHFLDGMTRLATLEAELDDVKKGLMARQGTDNFIPFHLFNLWGEQVLSVTDLIGGLWCQLKVEYNKLYPHLKHSREWQKMAETGSPVVLKTGTMKKGSEIHMMKELEVHDIVKVHAVTKEDRTAIQLANTYSQLAVVKTGGIEREIHVVGDLFDHGVLVRGTVDQLQFCLDTRELILTDHKTRQAKSLPKSEQKQITSLQLMLYKYLLDRMCLGLTKPEGLYRHLKLDREVVLTQKPLDHIRKCGLRIGTDSSGSRLGGVRFGEVVEHILREITQLELPLVGSLMVHYEHQSSGESLGVDTVEYDESKMVTELERALEYWEGRRPANGVDSESLWKCTSCQFKDICTWRLTKQLESSPAAKISPT